mgnify:CR=1 FL=1
MMMARTFFATFFATDDGGCLFDVLVETVGAGADDNLVDLDLAHLVDGAGVAGRCGNATVDLISDRSISMTSS